MRILTGLFLPFGSTGQIIFIFQWLAVPALALFSVAQSAPTYDSETRSMITTPFLEQAGYLFAVLWLSTCVAGGQFRRIGFGIISSNLAAIIFIGLAFSAAVYFYTQIRYEFYLMIAMLCGFLVYWLTFSVYFMSSRDGSFSSRNGTSSDNYRVYINPISSLGPGIIIGSTVLLAFLPLYPTMDGLWSYIQIAIFSGLASWALFSIDVDHPVLERALRALKNIILVPFLGYAVLGFVVWILGGFLSLIMIGNLDGDDASIYLYTFTNAVLFFGAYFLIVLLVAIFNYIRSGYFDVSSSYEVSPLFSVDYANNLELRFLYDGSFLIKLACFPAIVLAMNVNRIVFYAGMNGFGFGASPN